MFGYACDEAPEFMPAPLYYSHRLVEQQAKVRKNGKAEVAAPGREVAGHPALHRRPRDRRPGRVVLSTQHDPDIKQKDLVEAVRADHPEKPVLPKKWYESLPKNKVHINPTGIFVIGGPVATAA